MDRDESRASDLAEPFGGGKLNHELGASAGFALHIDATSVGFDDFSSGGESEPRAFGFGGVEGFEHAHGSGFIHAAAGIDHVQGDACGRGIGLDDQFAPVGHSFECVFHQVDEGGLQGAAVESDVG
jgi:hypothetical protein